MFLFKQRSVLLVKCENFTDFLQKVSTNDFSSFNEEIPVYTTFLNVNGTIVADFFVIKCTDFFLLEYNASIEDKITQYFEKYTSIYDFVIYKLSLKVYQFFQEEMNLITSLKEKFWFQDARNTLLGYRLWSTNTFEDDIQCYNKYENLRIDNFIAEFQKEIKPNISLPLDFYMHYAISGTKGCYVGQEVIARLKIKKIKKNLLAKFYINNNTTLDIQTQDHDDYEIYSSSREILISNAYIKTVVDTRGLIVLKKDLDLNIYGNQFILLSKNKKIEHIINITTYTE